MSIVSTGTTLVVGGTGGIGSAICRALAGHGSDVAFSYKTRADAAERLSREIETLGQKSWSARVDLTDPAAVCAFVDAAIAAFGTIDSVVYAAGPPLEFLYINEIDPVDWARVINADINGCFNLVSAVLPHFRARKRGNIVALVTAAVDRAPPRDILSAAPKAAIQMLIRGVAREEGRVGIRANCVGPGYIEAGLGLSTVHGHTADYVARMIRAIPLQRAGTAAEVADVVLFLLSDKARYVTGETINVAGGLQLA